ncbi:MAG: transferase [Muribaculaceae bacterium]|nr:transferase [Muribaculaceae bacterium]
MENIKLQNKIILAGGGGHALSLLEAAPLSDFAGYLALAPADSMPLEWLGDDAETAALAAKGYLFHIAYVYSGLPVMEKRRKLIEQYEAAGARFATIIAPTAIVTPNTHISEGCAILNGAIVNRATLGKNVVVNSGAIVEHDCVVGANTFIGPGAVIGGAVTIGDDCFIGLGAKIKNCVRIASGVTVAMGAIVTRDLLEPGIYHGTPLRRYKIY